MSTVEDYVARIEETCGEEKSAVVTFKYNKKDEAIAKIMKKAELKSSLSGIIFELAFQGTPFRMFSSGKLVFKSIKSKEAVHNTLAALLL
jgi:TATA-box binding protein (TBP) (component of TFIID and TFIIIB)